MNNAILFFFNINTKEVKKINDNYYFNYAYNNYVVQTYNRDIEEAIEIYYLNLELLSNGFIGYEIILTKDNDVLFLYEGVYYILMNSLGSVLESESCSVVYDAINVDELSQYKREHQITFNIYMLFGQIISYSFALILYTYFYNANILSIAISIMMFFSIVAATYLQKTETFLKQKRWFKALTLIIIFFFVYIISWTINRFRNIY